MRFVKGETLKEALRRFHAAESTGRDPGERSLGLAAVEREGERTANDGDEKDKALVAETTARQAEARARELAMGALRSLTDDVVEQQLARRLQLTEEDRAFLRKILKHYEAFAELSGDDAKSRAIRAEGYARVGLVRYGLGELKEAEAAYADALALRKQLAADFPSRHAL